MHSSWFILVLSPLAGLLLSIVLGSEVFLGLGARDRLVEEGGGGSLLREATEALRGEHPLMEGLLLEVGASPEGRDAEGLSLVFLAAEQGIDALVMELLAGGVDVNGRDRDGETLLHAAVRQGEERYLPLYWSFGAQVDLTNKRGEAPLHLAIESGARGLVVLLHERGARLDVPHPELGSPLMMAMARGDWAMVRQLLVLGASADQELRDGRTVVEWALDRGELVLAQLLVDHGAGVEGFLTEAVQGGDRELLEFLLRNGANPNPEGEESLLRAAVQGDEVEMARALLLAGAEAREGTDWAGQSLFHLAVARGQIEVVRDLLRQGVKVDAVFVSPVREEFVEVVKSEGKIKWFLAHDSRVTPLMLAADAGNLAMVQLLLDAGASTDKWTRRHRMWPVNFASRRDDVKMMQVMLGVDPAQEERWVKVDLSEQMAWVYGMDEEVLLETPISSGKSGYRTKTGSFVISNKYRSWSSTIYRGASMPYFQRLSCGDFGFHRGYCPGYAASHGCIRVPSGKASALYKLTRVGDRVVIVD